MRGSFFYRQLEVMQHIENGANQNFSVKWFWQAGRQAGRQAGWVRSTAIN
jgi:hypothetical protein